MKSFSSYAMLALPQQGSNQYGTMQSQWFISRGFESGFVGKKASALFHAPRRHIRISVTRLFVGQKCDFVPL